MKPEDQRRLQREADIAKAVRGPDYSRLESDIAKAKSEGLSKEHAGRLEDALRARIVTANRISESIVVPHGPDRKKDHGQDREHGQG